MTTPVFNVFDWHPLMSRTDQIAVEGFNGDFCVISGVGMKEDWGPILAPGSTGLFEPPAKTNWAKGLHGQRFQSWSAMRRDVIFTIHIVNPESGDPLIDTNRDLWRVTWARWRAMWSYDFESTIVYTSVHGERRLKARLLQEPKPFQAQQWEGGDPGLCGYGSITMAVACELPYYVGAVEKHAYEFDGDGDHWFRIPFYNPSAVAIWPRWWLSDRAAYVLPDFSWGWQEHGRGVLDFGKTVRVPRVGELLEGENIDILTTPDEETIRAENDAPVGNRMGGTDFEYPIQPGCGDPPEFDDDGHSVNGAAIRMLNITNPAGSRVELELDRWYDQPFGDPLIA